MRRLSALVLGGLKRSTWMAIGASLVVFSAYYAALMTGEGLADQRVVSPVLGMWGANGLVLTFALLAAW